MPFQKATKQQAKLRLALIGPAGSGKTYSALTLATHLVPDGKIALIDTERGSAAKYADLFDFDVQELASYHPQRYIEAISEAQAAGYAVLIIDSLSHAWMGKDGALELVDKAAKRNTSGNSFAAWRDITPLHNALVDAMLATQMHVIVTLRSKMEYVMEKDDKGKTVIRKIGLQPVQRDGLEYEFDVVGDLDQDNTLLVTKTRCSALTGAVIAKPGKALAQALTAWLQGTPPTEPPAPRQPEPPPPAPVITAPTLSKATGNGSNGNGGNGNGSNGHGKLKATISTGQWAAAAKALAQRCPCYLKNGQPDWLRLLTLAPEGGYPDINDGNLAAVITLFEQTAQTPVAA